jgi:hypothetical protein
VIGMDLYTNRTPARISQWNPETRDIAASEVMPPVARGSAYPKHKALGGEFYQFVSSVCMA